MNNHKYKIAFDFTTVNPNTSLFTGKCGEFEFTIDRELSDEEMETMKGRDDLKSDIARLLKANHNQKNIFMVTIKTIEKI